MKGLRKYLDKIKPQFEEGGKLSKFHSVFDGLETFLFVPSSTSQSGVHIHDAIDTKRVMTTVLIALMPALLFGMFNIGYQHYLAIGESDAPFLSKFLFGFLAVLPKIIVSYGVGLGIEFIVAQYRNHEIQEGFLVSGMLIPMIVPIDTPLWMIAIATAFSVIFAKEIFGGTGMNIFNVALITRAFLFFAYPAKMSGDIVFVRTDPTFDLGSGTLVNGYSGATPLGQIAVASKESFHGVKDIIGNPLSTWDYFLGLIPGSIGETSTLAIMIGAIILIATGVGSWKIIVSVFTGGFLTCWLFNIVGGNVALSTPALSQIFLGGFAFGAVFMATDPVTGSRTELGKYIYGFLIGVISMLVRVVNPGYPEGVMLAILLMNMFAPLIDFYVVEANTRKRLKRWYNNQNTTPI